MTDPSLERREDADISGAPPTDRRKWRPPAFRLLKTSEAELGPNFTATDGVEGHS